MRWQRYLRNLYRNLKKGGSFQSAEKLLHTVRKEGRHNISLAMIQKWLEGEESYTLNKEVRAKFGTNYIEMGELDSMWEMDLSDLSQQHPSLNDSVKFLLGCIDSYSRKLYVRPLKTKHASVIVSALKDIFDKSGRQPRSIRSDRGSEFTNNVVAKFLESRNIGQTFTSNQSQSAIIERCWKSLKKRMTKYLDNKKSPRYIDILDDLVKGYNETYHSSIGMTPNEVTKENELEVSYNHMIMRKKRLGTGKRKINKIPQEQADDVLPPSTKNQDFSFEIGTHVRLSLRPERIVSEYKHRWTQEIFTISSRWKRNGIPVYKVKDETGEVLYGSFYTQELQRVKKPKKNKLYDIKKIIKSRLIRDEKGKTNKEYLVSFVGFPSKFIRWIPADSIKSTTNI